ISVVSDTRLSEVFRGNGTVWTSRVVYLDAVIEPVDAYRSVRTLVGAVHDGVASELLQRNPRVGRRAQLKRLRFDVHRHDIVCIELLVEATDNLTDRTVDYGLVDDRVGPLRSLNPHELHISSR